MENPFSKLELQLIRSSLFNKTDEEIAALLERPVEEVHDKILELLGGNIEERIRELQSFKNKNLKKRTGPRTKIEKVQGTENKTRVEIQKRERAKQLNYEEKRKVERRAEESRKKFQNRVTDPKDMISIKIDSKTTLFVKKGSDIKKIKEQYSRIWQSQQKNDL